MAGASSVRLWVGVPGYGFGMPLVHRILPQEPIESLDRYLSAGGGRGLAAALDADPSHVVGLIDAAGLRGRGGAGFPTGRKWSTVASSASTGVPTTVVVNAAEGEPGTFKDRSLLRATPYSVLEGALIAAAVVGAERVVVGMKESFVAERTRVEAAIAELVDARWSPEVTIEVAVGPKAYLLGEETAMLEAIEGRPPFPRIAPPYRDGVEADGAGPATDIALVDNVETFANVAAIVADGPVEYRSLGTADSPGTLICTVTGSVTTPGVGEVPMGTTLREVVELVGGGAIEGRTIVAVLPGVSAGVIVGDGLDTPLTYEAMAAIGSGLGSGGYQVFDDRDDMVAVAAGVSRFLYVESCGQCTPCKSDGGAISELLDRVVAGDLGSDAERDDSLAEIHAKLDTVAVGARCSLASQHEAVVRSIVDAFGDHFEEHLRGGGRAGERALVADLVDVHDGFTLVDEQIRRRQPDWSEDEVDSGMSPVERLMSPA